MSPFLETVIAGAIIIGFIGKLIAPFWDVNKKEVKNNMLREFIDSAVKAAEKLDVSGALNGKTKYDYVTDLVAENFPKRKESLEVVDMLIHAAIRDDDSMKPE